MRCKFCGSGNLEWVGESPTLKCSNPACAMVWVPNGTEKHADRSAHSSEAGTEAGTEAKVKTGMETKLKKDRCPTCDFPLDTRGYCPNCGWYRTKLQTDDKNISELG